MSRDFRPQDRVSVGFPRVSGDEPKIRTTDGAWGWFSRRERGLSPRGMWLWGHCANFLFELMENTICCCKKGSRRQSTLYASRRTAGSPYSRRCPICLGIIASLLKRG